MCCCSAVGDLLFRSHLFSRMTIITLQASNSFLPGIQTPSWAMGIPAIRSKFVKPNSLSGRVPWLFERAVSNKKRGTREETPQFSTPPSQFGASHCRSIGAPTGDVIAAPRVRGTGGSLGPLGPLGDSLLTGDLTGTQGRLSVLQGPPCWRNNTRNARNTWPGKARRTGANQQEEDDDHGTTAKDCCILRTAQI